MGCLFLCKERGADIRDDDSHGDDNHGDSKSNDKDTSTNNEHGSTVTRRRRTTTTTTTYEKCLQADVRQLPLSHDTTVNVVFGQRYTLDAIYIFMKNQPPTIP